MSIIRNIPEFLRQVEKNQASRQQRKMIDIDVIEVSGVDHPAHMRRGWLVKKSAGKAHDHRKDAHYIDLAEETGLEPPLKAGESVPLGPGRTLGRDDCGCLYMLTPETVSRAEGEAYAKSIVRKEAPRYSPEDIRFLLGDGK